VGVKRWSSDGAAPLAVVAFPGRAGSIIREPHKTHIRHVSMKTGGKEEFKFLVISGRTDLHLFLICKMMTPYVSLTPVESPHYVRAPRKSENG